MGLVLNPLKIEFLLHDMYINPVRTSQETRYVTATKTNRSMLFMETVAVYCENHAEHTNKVCGQNVEFYYVKPTFRRNTSPPTSGWKK
jgi:hypothetical protein